MKNVLKVENVTMQFGGVVAVDNLTMEAVSYTHLDVYKRQPYALRLRALRTLVERTAVGRKDYGAAHYEAMERLLHGPGGLLHLSLIHISWEPVVTMTCCSGGRFFSRLRSTTVPLGTFISVSYTHLDVYKRQAPTPMRGSWSTLPKTPWRP